MSPALQVVDVHAWFRAAVSACARMSTGQGTASVLTAAGIEVVAAPGGPRVDPPAPTDQPGVHRRLLAVLTCLRA